MEFKDAGGIAKEDRKDSGLGEDTKASKESMITATSIPKDEDSPSPIQQNVLTKSRKQATSNTSGHPQRPKQNSRIPNTSASQPSSRPTSARRPNTSRRTSTEQASFRSSISCSRRSSFLIHQPSQTYNGRPRVPQRMSSAARARTYSYGSTNHRAKGIHLFQSLDASLAGRPDFFASRPREHLTSASSPTLLHSHEHSSSSTLVNIEQSQPQRSYSNYVPQPLSTGLCPLLDFASVRRLTDPAEAFGAWCGE